MFVLHSMAVGFISTYILFSELFNKVFVSLRSLLQIFFCFSPRSVLPTEREKRPPPKRAFPLPLFLPRSSLHSRTLFIELFPLLIRSASSRTTVGPPIIFNSWGERSCPEYLLLKRGFGTRTRRLPARKSIMASKRNDALEIGNWKLNNG